MHVVLDVKVKILYDPWSHGMCLLDGTSIDDVTFEGGSLVEVTCY